MMDAQFWWTIFAKCVGINLICPLIGFLLALMCQPATDGVELDGD